MVIDYQATNKRPIKQFIICHDVEKQAVNIKTQERDRQLNGTNMTRTLRDQASV